MWQITLELPKYDETENGHNATNPERRNKMEYIHYRAQEYEGEDRFPLLELSSRCRRILLISHVFVVGIGSDTVDVENVVLKQSV